MTKRRAGAREERVGKVEVSRRHVVRVLHDSGLPHVAREAERVLPDPVEYERAAELLSRYGITKDELISRRGGSP